MKRDEHFETKLNEIARRFEQWRQQGGQLRRPIPEPLWEAAVALARTYGVFAVAQPLRLDYAKLKERSGIKPIKTGGTLAFPFVEVALPDLGLSSGYTVKLENRTGAGMTVGLPAGSHRALMDLAEVFLRPRS